VPEIQKVHPDYDGRIDGSSGLLVIKGDVTRPKDVIASYDAASQEGFQLQIFTYVSRWDGSLFDETCSST